MDTPEIEIYDAEDPKINEIIEKIKYQSNNVTLDEWALTYDKRNIEMLKITSSSDVVNFFQKWKLYLDKPIYVSI